MRKYGRSLRIIIKCQECLILICPFKGDTQNIKAIIKRMAKLIHADLHKLHKLQLYSDVTLSVHSGRWSMGWMTCWDRFPKTLKICTEELEERHITFGHIGEVVFDQLRFPRANNDINGMIHAPYLRRSLLDDIGWNATPTWASQ